MVRLRINGGKGLKQIIADLDREKAELPQRVKAEMDEVLASAFAESQARIHVVSGALKASGQCTSEVTATEYRGEISYGGPLAPHAVYELNVRGHSPTDEVLVEHDSAFTEALNRAAPFD